MRILVLILISMVSFSSLAKDKQAQAYATKIKEAIKVGKSMEKMDSAKCIPLMKKLQPEMREISQKILDLKIDQAKSDALYEASVNATYCVKCLRVSAMKSCNKAEKNMKDFGAK